MSGDMLLVLPPAIFFALFFIAPLVLLMGISAFTSQELSAVGLDQYARFVKDQSNLEILLGTMALGAEVTIVTLLLGYPVAWLYMRVSPRLQTAIIFVVILPLLTSVVVRTFAWIVILGRQGIVNSTLLDLGLVDQPVRLLYTQPGVVVALAQVMMPMMVLPLINTLQRIDVRLLDASSVLGASDWRTFFKVLLPLSLPGIVAGSLLTFAGAVTAFVTHTLVGGQRLVFMPFHIYQHALLLQDWPFAAALSILFVVAVFVMVFAFAQLGRASHRYVQV